MKKVKVLKAYKYRIYPHEKMLPLLKQYVGMTRFVWNQLVAEQDRRYKIKRQQNRAFCRLFWLDYVLLDTPFEDDRCLAVLICHLLTRMPYLSHQGKNDEFHLDKISIYTWASTLKNQYPFLQDYPSKMLLKVCDSFGRAFSDAFKTDKGFPKFKKKGRGDSFGCDDFSLEMDGSHPYITLPVPQGLKGRNKHKAMLLNPNGKIAKLLIRQHRALEGKAKNITISCKAEQWYIAIQVETEQEIKAHPHPDVMVGGDRGVAKSLVLSTGEMLNLGEDFNSSRVNLDKAEAKKKKYQRLLNRKREKNGNKVSQRYLKIKQQLARQSLRVSNMRHDFVHKVTHYLSQNHALVVLEDLKTKNMTASAKGTAEAHGKNVKQKAGLNRSILEQNWYEVQRQLAYKMTWINGKVAYVDPKHTSQMCSECGHVAKVNRQSQSVFQCVACGHEENADVNAAKNILSRFLKSAAEGCSVEGRGGDTKGEERCSETGVADEASRLLSITTKELCHGIVNGL